MAPSNVVFLPYTLVSSVKSSSPHGSDVDDLEIVDVDGAVHVNVFADLVQDGKQSDVGFTGAGGSAKQKVLVRLERRFVQTRLNAIQLLESFKGRLSPFRQIADGNQSLVLFKRFGFQGGDVNFLVTWTTRKE